MKTANLLFFGDIMLGREIKTNFLESPNSIIKLNIRALIEKHNSFCIANLESPIVDEQLIDEDESLFFANSKLLDKIKFIDLLCLANNHINDGLQKGLHDTIASLDTKKISHNGVFTDEYDPFDFEKGGIKFSVINCTDFSNLSENENSDYKINFTSLDQIKFLIESKKKEKRFVIVYIHGGIMFSKYPNPKFRTKLQQIVNYGSDLVISVHPHVLGGYEIYNNKPIIYSLGDFIMDGKSFRRRTGAILQIKVMENHQCNFSFHPTYITKNHFVTLKKGFFKRLNLLSINRVKRRLENTNNQDYIKFYKKKYPLQIFIHAASTILYQLIHKGPVFILKLFYKRAKDFKNMYKWLKKDTSKMTHNLEDKTML